LGRTERPFKAISGLDKTGYAKRAAELVRSPMGGDIDGYKTDREPKDAAFFCPKKGE
jgi:hypothetical protein